MHFAFPTLRWAPLALALALPGAVSAQAFSADYGLARLRISPILLAESRFTGAGLSLDSGRNWFGQVGLGRSLHQGMDLPGQRPYEDMLNISGGYRWSDGQSVSLQLHRGRSNERLGLAVRYDWPRYFVRLSYDSGLAPVPQDNLRFSAGVRF